MGNCLCNRGTRVHHANIINSYVYRDYHVISIGTLGWGSREISYDVKDFVKRFDKSPASVDKINRFAKRLDIKTHINHEDPENEEVYGHVEKIVKRLLKELAFENRTYKGASIRATGSISADVKSGLPHEEDFLLVLKRPRVGKLRVDYIFKLVRKIVSSEKSKKKLTKGLGDWLIHGVTEHPKVGVCLIMQYTAERDQPPMGVTVDLIPVYCSKSKDKSVKNTSFSSKALNYLPCTFDQYVDNGDMYQLIERKECDTGILENLIIKDLSVEKKRGLRIAKYLIRYFFGYDVQHLPSAEGSQDDDFCNMLYGLTPVIRSYYVKVLFLHFIVNIQGTPLYDKLSDGLLALCLLDMLNHVYSSARDLKEKVVYLKHPLCPQLSGADVPIIEFPHHLLDDIIKKFALAKPYNGLAKYNLLNNTMPRLPLQTCFSTQGKAPYTRWTDNEK